MIESFKNYIEQNPNYSAGIKILILLSVAFIINLFIKKIILSLIKRAVLKTKNNWDDIFLENRVFEKLANIVPAIIVYNFSFLFINAEETAKRIILSYIVFVCIVFINSFINAVNDIYNSLSYSKDKPIKGYLQIVKLLAYITGFLIIISIMINKSPVLLLSGIGAMMAVLLLIFKDTILSLVASVQIRTDDMIKMGDWITMPKFDADGDVIDIALHTVKIQNFDKTITTIPTYKFIEESFQNWRGMTESNGRRIKRSVNIDMSSIRFLDLSDIGKFKKIRLLKDYIEGKIIEIDEYNQKFNERERNFVNQRNLTNIGTFRLYLKNYLHSHPKINTEMTFLVRQLSPGPEGLPIEIYVFSNNNRWVEYEDIQADIFDHILAIIPEFDLAIYQRPSGNDIQSLKGTSK
ncbi:MAG: mechanosensitive ion channel family protein [Candidatus Delongbacteria bacterium]|nr:mechanosensitive ion channel family protein [Candidatus Delongbacteria bacterium]